MNCRTSLAERLQVLHRNSVVMTPAQATPTKISKAWACLRTSIFFRQSDAMTNVRADLMASRHCIFAPPAQLASRSMRAWQCIRRKRLTEASASFRTSCGEVACEVQPKRGDRDVASPSNLVTMGRKLDRIHNYDCKKATALCEAVVLAGWVVAWIDARHLRAMRENPWLQLHGKRCVLLNVRYAD
jgi:hypothetical protein